MWIDRAQELKTLRKLASGSRAELLILYGRRRVGKSELLDRFLEGRKGVRLLARQESEKLQLRHFSSILAGRFRDPVLASNPFASWDAFFTYLSEKAGRQRLEVALDEFPYLVEANRSLPSLLQYHWDERLKKSRLLLVLCGSSIGMMEDLMGSKSPIYGRRTGQMLLRPFRFADVLPWIGEAGEAVKSYAVFGGTPAYFLEYDRKKSLLQNVKDRILSPERSLFKDPEFVLRQEVREPRVYFSILESVAKGHTRIGAIMNDTGLDKGTVGKYVGVLSDLHLLEREVPVTEANPAKSRRGVYRLSDHYFRFWFRFVYPNLQVVEQGRQAWLVDEVIRPRMSEFVGPVFESVAREAIEAMSRRRELPFSLVRLGRWWEKDAEIDLIGIGKGENLFVEVKWSERVDAPKLLRKLENAAPKAGLKGEARYCLVARSFARKARGAVHLDLRAMGGLLG